MPWRDGRSVTGSDQRPRASVTAVAMACSRTTSPFRLTERDCTITGAPASGVPSSSAGLPASVRASPAGG
jgi:hypothetical protein